MSGLSCFSPCISQETFLPRYSCAIPTMQDVQWALRSDSGAFHWHPQVIDATRLMHIVSKVSGIDFIGQESGGGWSPCASSRDIRFFSLGWKHQDHIFSLRWGHFLQVSGIILLLLHLVLVLTSLWMWLRHRDFFCRFRKRDHWKTCSSLYPYAWI